MRLSKPAWIVPVAVTLLGLSQTGLRGQTIVPNPGVSLVVPLTSPEVGAGTSPRAHVGSHPPRAPSLSARQKRALARAGSHARKAARAKAEAERLKARRKDLRLDTARRYAARAERALSDLQKRWRGHPTFQRRIEEARNDLARMQARLAAEEAGLRAARD